MKSSFKTEDHGNFIIRQSTITDTDSIINLERLVFDAKLRYGPSLIYALIHTASPNLALTAVTKSKNQIIGFISGEIDNYNKELARIVTIEVHPNFQRNHVGGKLLHQFEENLQSYHVKKIELQVHSMNQKAISFYELHGYLKIKELRNYYERHEHAFLMEKEVF
ncbi:MAG: GNAT family N-acetyltransferase [Candidatus Hodarchaeales archaeon]|jgi:ribosomal protein S18 acetylase RimI-like enzyme